MASTNLTSPDAIRTFLDGPAMAPPIGVEPNFNHPPGFQTTMRALQIFFVALSTLAIFIRLYVRIKIYKKVNLEDYVAVLGWLGYLTLLIITVRGLNSSAGIHQWDVQAKRMKRFQHYLHISVIIYGIDMFIIKLSILLQYVSIFSPKRRDTFFWTCHTLIGLNFVTYATFVLLEIIPCKLTGIKYDLEKSRSQNRGCMDFRVVTLATGAVNTASHLIILLLPQVIIWRLKMKFRKRLGVSLVFAVALIACMAMVVRLYYTITLLRTPDITWYIGLNLVLIYPEIGFGIVTSCLPSFPKFFRAFFEKRPTSVGFTKTQKSFSGRFGGNELSVMRVPSDSVGQLIDNVEMQTPSRGRSGEGIYEEVDFVGVEDSRLKR